ncbi:MAG: 2-oxoacid:acceptor oxidoreductase subunit alpha, partial [Methanobacteriota archaeon]
NLIHFTEVYPLPTGLEKVFGKAGETVCVENNATGQFARLLRMETGFQVSHQILKYDGRPFTPEHIIRELKERGLV